MRGQGHCNAGTGLGPFVPLKGDLNATALWQQVGKVPHMAGMVRCPYTFGHSVFRQPS